MKAATSSRLKGRRFVGRVAIAAVLALFVQSLIGAGTGYAQGMPEPGPDPSYGPPADLGTTLQGPEGIPLAGADFDMTATASNAGPNDATDAHLSIYIPPNLTFRSVSDPTCAFQEYQPYAYGGRESQGQHRYPTKQGSGGSVECALGTMASGDARSFTVGVTRADAREVWTSSSVWSNNEDANYENNYGEVHLKADQSNPADVGVTLSNPTEVPVDSDFDYTLTVTNAGPSTADDVVVTDSWPQGVDYRTASSSDPNDTCTYVEYPAYDEPQSDRGTRQSPDYYYRYSEVVCELGSIPAGETVTLTLGATRTSPWDTYNNAWVYATNYDENYENDYAYSELPADPSITTDLSMSVQGPSGGPLVGEAFDVVFTVRNNGPSSANDTWLSSYLPAEVVVNSVTPSSADDTCTTGGSSGDQPVTQESGKQAPAEDGYVSPVYYDYNGFDCQFGTLPVGDSASVTVNLTRKAAREIWASAWASSQNYELQWEDNWAEFKIEPDRSHPADLSLDKSAPKEAPVDSDFDYTLTVTNNGPDVATDVRLVDYMPDGVDFKAVTSSDATDNCALYEENYGEPEPLQAEDRPSYYYAYREVRCDMGSMESGETATVTVSVTRSTEYELWNSASVSTASFDENYDNDWASALVSGKSYWGDCPVVAEGETKPKTRMTQGGGGSDGCDPDGSVCGSKDDDSIVIGSCYVEAKGGADDIQATPGSEDGDMRVSAGGGRDSITLTIPTGSETRRKIHLDGGRGSDYVTITSAPGAGNVTVFVNGGKGSDQVSADIPAGTDGIKIVMRGGRGNDWLLGGSGDDVVNGGRGRDVVDGGPGDDRISGGAGDDTCRDGPGLDRVSRC